MNHSLFAYLRYFLAQSVRDIPVLPVLKSAGYKQKISACSLFAGGGVFKVKFIEII